MQKIRNIFNRFSHGEIALWLSSVIIIMLFFVIFDRANYVKLAASLIGTTSLIFYAKGNPAGPGLMIVFCLLYGAISFSFSYYGEMITYLGMTAPMTVVTLISWLRNPFNGNAAEVTVNRVGKTDIVYMLVLSAAVTVLFYFILASLRTANLAVSTFSVTTSFIAVYLTAKRSPYYALAYAVNDVVLIVLWILAAVSNISYISVVICFIMFLINDIYGFINWMRIQKRQQCCQ